MPVTTRFKPKASWLRTHSQVLSAAAQQPATTIMASRSRGLGMRIRTNSPAKVAGV